LRRRLQLCRCRHTRSASYLLVVVSKKQTTIADLSALEDVTNKTLEQCARCYQLLRGYPWPAEIAEHMQRDLERCNNQERDAYPAFVALQKALILLRDYYRKHPARGELPITLRGMRAELKQAAFVDRDYDVRDEGHAWSNHGSLLQMIRGNIEPILQIPWATQERTFTPRGGFRWERRTMIITLYDKEYFPSALHVRSPGATSPTRLTVTELAWHSLLHGNWPKRVDVSDELLTPDDVIAAEAKDIADAQSRALELKREITAFFQP